MRCDDRAIGTAGIKDPAEFLRRSPANGFALRERYTTRIILAQVPVS